MSSSTTSVHASAAAYPPAPSATAPVLVAAAVSLAAALAGAADVAVLALLVFGVAHVCFEVRFVLGRYGPGLDGAPLWVVHALLGVIVLGRLAVPGGWRTGELAALGLLAAVALATARRRRRAVVAAAVGAPLWALAWWQPATWFAVQAHVHNLAAAGVLWDVTGDRTVALPPQAGARRRRAERSAVVLTGLGVPALVLSGALDPLIRAGASAAARAGGEPSSVAASFTPPGLRHGALPSRFLVAFAFGQLFHYALWCVVLPRRCPQAATAFAARPAGRLLGRWGLVVVGAALSVAVLAAAAVAYRHGRTLYVSLGGYHAYLEYPLIIAAVLAAGRKDHA